MILKDIIFKLFGAYDKRIDPNKDINDKGTLERFNETVADDYDANLHPLMDNLLYNLTDPLRCQEKYLRILELGKGNESLSIDDSMPLHRKVQLFIVK